jgi:hypothetical protein
VTIPYTTHTLPQSTPTCHTHSLSSRRPFGHCQDHGPIPPTISKILYSGSEYEDLTGRLLIVYINPSSGTGKIYSLTILVAVSTSLSIVTSYTVTTLTLKLEDVGAGLKLQNVLQISV